MNNFNALKLNPAITNKVIAIAASNGIDLNTVTTTDGVIWIGERKTGSQIAVYGKKNWVRINTYKYHNLQESELLGGVTL